MSEYGTRLFYDRGLHMDQDFDTAGVKHLDPKAEEVDSQINFI